MRIIEKGVPFQVGEFKVTPFGVPHDSTDNVGYFVECEGVTFCLITDVGHITEEIQDFIGKANYLVLESNHSVEMLQQGHYPQYLKDRILGPNGHLSNDDCAHALADFATRAFATYGSAISVRRTIIPNWRERPWSRFCGAKAS